MTFQLEQAKATLAHINPRTEKHGEQDVPAADLKVQMTEGNGILTMFHGSLRSTLYKVDESEGQLEGVEALTVRRFGSLIERLRFDHSLKGADVVIGFGTGGVSDIELSTVDVDGFSCELMEGGSVSLTFRIKARPTGDQMKRLYEILGGEIDITVTPAVEKQGSLGLPTEVE